MNDLNSIIEAAWKDYRASLAEALDALDDDARIQIKLDSEGCDTVRSGAASGRSDPAQGSE